MNSDGSSDIDSSENETFNTIVDTVGSIVGTAVGYGTYGMALEIGGSFAPVLMYAIDEHDIDDKAREISGGFVKDTLHKIHDLAEPEIMDCATQESFNQRLVDIEINELADTRSSATPYNQPSSWDNVYESESPASNGWNIDKTTDPTFGNKAWK